MADIDEPEVDEPRALKDKWRAGFVSQEPLAKAIVALLNLCGTMGGDPINHIQAKLLRQLGSRLRPTRSGCKDSRVR